MQCDNMNTAAEMTVSDELLQEFSTFVANEIGWHFPCRRWPDLLRGMYGVAQDCGQEGLVPCMQSLMAEPLARQHVEILGRHLSIGETYFFREQPALTVLENEILRPLIEHRRNNGKYLRIWSAGCCTGEEIYSIAILLHRLIPDIADWKLMLLGTDINPDFLNAARRGVYRAWSFRNTPGHIIDRYFNRTGNGEYAIAPELKRHVVFDYFNLVADSSHPDSGRWLSEMDIVLCRNVLMYFTQAGAQRAIERLYQEVASGGWLIASPAESGHFVFSRFERVCFSDVVLYRKNVRQPVTGLTGQQAVLFPLETVQCNDQSFFIPAPIPIPIPVTNTVTRTLPDEEPDPDLQTLATRARGCADQGKLSEAIGWCNAAIAADKCDPALHYLHATILEEQGKFDDAVKALKRTLYFDSGFVLAHFALGSLCRRMKRPQEATRHFANTVDLLRQYAPNEMLAGAEDMSAGYLLDLMHAKPGSI